MERRHEEETIDNKQFSITTKLAITFLVGWTTVIISIFGTYSSLKTEFSKNDQTNALQDAAIENIRVDMKTMQNSIEINRQHLSDHDKVIGDNSARITILELKQDKQ